MKILHTISGLGRGGAEHMLLRLIESTPSLRHVVVSLSGAGELGGPIRQTGARLYALEARSGGLLRMLRRLRAIAGGERPDLVQGWMNHGNVAGLLTIAGRRNTPLIWNIRQSLSNFAFETPGTRRLIRLQALASVVPDAIIYNSEQGALEHEAVGFVRRKRRIIANGFDTSRFRPDRAARQAVRAELGIADEEVAIGLVARFHPWKNHAGFLHAAEMLRRKDQNLRFVLVGEGVTLDNAQLLSMIESEELKGRCIFLGNRSDVERLSTAFDIACNTSHGEGFPNAVGEAMAVGVPCVVTPAGASAELVGKTGQVAQSASVSDIVIAVEAMLAIGPEGRRRLGEAARTRIVECFSIDAISRSYLDLYHKVATRLPSFAGYEQ